MSVTRTQADLNELPEWCDAGTVEQIEETISGYPIFSIEENGVWISGMNAHSGTQARRVADTLEQYCGCIVDLEYPEKGGLFVPVKGVVSDE